MSNSANINFSYRLLGRFLLTAVPEIVSRVFDIGVATQREEGALEQDETQRKRLPFELLVSHICARTRQIALQDCKLWSTICLSPCTKSERVQAYLTRSGEASLHIIVNGSLSIPGNNGQIVSIPDALLDLVLPHSPRWCSLSIAERNSVVRRICNYPAPNLRYLSLSVDDIEGAIVSAPNSNIYSPQIFRTGAQHLKSIRLRGLALHLYRPRFNAVVTLQLEETKQIPLSYENFREIILCSPSLANLSIYGDVVQFTPGTLPENQIHLPSLQSLRIRGVSSEVFSGVLRVIGAPNLNTLTLKGLHEHDLDALQSLMDITKFTNLKCLNFCDFDVSVYTYEHITRVFRNITCFCTLHPVMSNSNLVELLLDNSEGIGEREKRWPTLGQLKFRSTSGLPDSEESEAKEEADKLDELIKARKRDRCPIKRVSFWVDVRDHRDRSRDEVKDENEDKVEVEIVYSSILAGWPDPESYDVDDAFDDAV